jgi:hypothetical protein
MILLARVDESVPSTPEAGKITVYYVLRRNLGDWRRSGTRNVH